MKTGRKLKSVGAIIGWLGIPISILAGIALLIESSFSSALILPGILTLVVGSLLFGLISLKFSGFGQLVEDTARIAKMLETSSPADLKALSKHGNCELCDKKDVDVVNCKIVDSQGTRYRDLCVECMAKTNAEPTEKK